MKNERMCNIFLVKEKFNIIDILQLIIGTLFIFSGVIKGIDPFGTALKIREYCKLFNILLLDSSTMVLSVLLCTIEIFIGIMLITFLHRKIVIISAITILVVFSVFMLFLFVMPEYRIEECGCFGNLLPMTIGKSLLKNLLFLIISIFILVKIPHKNNSSVRIKPLIFISIVSFFIPYYASKNLEFLNISEYKVGAELKNIDEFKIYNKSYINILDSLEGTNKKHILLILKQELTNREQAIVDELNGSDYKVTAIISRDIPLKRQLDYYYANELILNTIIRSYRNAAIIIENGIIKKKIRIIDIK